MYIYIYIYLYICIICDDKANKDGDKPMLGGRQLTWT